MFLNSYGKICESESL